MGTNVTSTRQPARDWVQVYAELSTRDDDLSPEDLERYSIAAHLLGKDEQAYRLLDRAHTGYLDQGAPEKAARAVFWLIFHLRNAHQTARAAGWVGRLLRILDDCDRGGQQSYLPLLLDGVPLMQAGSVSQALPMLEQAAAEPALLEMTTCSSLPAWPADAVWQCKDGQRRRSPRWMR